MFHRVSVDETALRALWAENVSIVAIASKLKVLEWDVIRAARELNLPSRSGSVRPAKDAADPTQWEIEQRAQEVRDRWTPQEMRRRAIGGRSERYEVPTLQFDQRRR